MTEPFFLGANEATKLSHRKQLWDKDVQKRYPGSLILTVQDGVKHIRLTKYVNGRKVRINVVEINTSINKNISLKPVLASNTLSNKASIRTIAQKENTIAAINGSYFKPQNGIPLGTMMVNKDILTGPVYNRVALGIADGYYRMSRVDLNARLQSKDTVLKIDNINQPRMLSTYVLVYTRKWGAVSPPPPQYGVQITIEDNKVTHVGYGSNAIPENGYVIVGPKSKLEPFFNAKDIKIDIKTTPEWDDVNHIISGGPYLVKEGNVYVDVNEQKLNSIAGKNPRTAIGYTLDNNFIMVTVDGREETSVGMTIWELAKFMKQIGCQNAMNLDGGGSSVMYLNGSLINSPSIKGGIAISNALVLYTNKELSASKE
ncbi:MAG: phosphodiester glycosidase family protein [Candidatus Gastranaerophilales bacterium]|nr:phosphodiester glycosidase family protein [Candidatus Gastranaerophilales bacterium]